MISESAGVAKQEGIGINPVPCCGRLSTDASRNEATIYRRTGTASSPIGANMPGIRRPYRRCSRNARSCTSIYHSRLATNRRGGSECEGQQYPRVRQHHPQLRDWLPSILGRVRPPYATIMQRAPTQAAVGLGCRTLEPEPKCGESRPGPRLYPRTQQPRRPCSRVIWVHEHLERRGPHPSEMNPRLPPFKHPVSNAC
jgi:hypothetical protein